MFVDYARIRVTGGAGGNGCCSIRREKFVPLGGPNGGDGGHGGDVIIAASSRLTTLLDLRYHSTWKGLRGEHGQGSDCHGKCASETVILVPKGTLVRDHDTNEILCDLTEEGQRFVAAKGGRGGRGNTRFANAKNRCPRFAENGEPGEERAFILELKIIAEVGLVGLPNAGKSTLLSRISAARPKIADYPFTTLSPNLGMVRLDEYRVFSVADIPGIIEGAAEGKGLGHDFLRHIERTSVLLFLIDLGDENPAETLEVLEKELLAHSPVFESRPRIYALNKADLTGHRERFDSLQEHFPGAYCISGVTGEGIPGLLNALWNEVERAREARENEPAIPEPEREYRYEAPFTITRQGDVFVVEGPRVIRAVKTTDFDNPDAVKYLQHSLGKMGLFKALKRMGAQPGQSIRIGDLEMEYHPD